MTLLIADDIKILKNISLGDQHIDLAMSVRMSFENTIEVPPALLERRNLAQIFITYKV